MLAKVAGVETRILLDTGAQVSVVPKQFWLSATNGGSALMDYHGKVAVADGGEMEIMGCWQTVCQFESLCLVTEFLVANITPQDVLLGSDFLLKFGAVIDLGERCCRLMGKIIPLQLDADEMAPCKQVTVCTDTKVPPRSETIIFGKVEGAAHSRIVGMLEPSPSFSQQCNMLVARVVCHIESGVMPVHIINVTEDTHTLRQGMKIGTVFTDIEVGEGVDQEQPSEAELPQPWSVEDLFQQFQLGDKGFSNREVCSIRDLLQRHASVFSSGDADLGRTHLTCHQINTGSARPNKMPPRRVPIHLQQEVNNHVKQCWIMA